MAEERSADRLVVFTDAVVAIAITLLVLPLAEVARDEKSGLAVHPLVEQLTLDAAPLFGLTLSFFVIGRFWWSHHSIFSRIERYTRALVVTTMLWLFTIVLLPASTAIITMYDPVDDRLPVAIYIGNMLASSIGLSVLAAIGHLDPRVSSRRGVDTRNRLIGAVAATCALTAALLLGTLVPLINYWAIWLLVLTPPVEMLVRRRLARRDAALHPLSGAHGTLTPGQGASESAPGLRRE